MNDISSTMKWKLGIAVAAVMNSPEYTELTDIVAMTTDKKWKEGTYEKFGELIFKYLDEKYVHAVAESTLIPGLREVNDQLESTGRVVSLTLNDGRLIDISLIYVLSPAIRHDISLP